MFSEGDQTDILEGWRDKGWGDRLKRDPQNLRKLLILWSDVCSEILFECFKDSKNLNVKSIPRGFEELSRVLAWWCDTGPYSIDPTPFCEASYFAEEIAGNSRVGDHKAVLHSLDRFSEAVRKSVIASDRMAYAAFTAAEISPPESITRQEGFLVSEVASLLKIDGKTVNKYATQANIPTPGQGKRNHRYSAEDVVNICHAIVTHSSSDQMTSVANEVLAEMETK